MLLLVASKFPRNGNTFISDYLVQYLCVQSWQYWAALSSRGHCWVSKLPTQLKCRWSEISFVGPTGSAFRNLEKCGLKHCIQLKPRTAEKRRSFLIWCIIDSYPYYHGEEGAGCLEGGRALCGTGSWAQSSLAMNGTLILRIFWIWSSIHPFFLRN